jgi:hypothetical protein
VEITSADDSALLEVRDAQAKSTLAKSESIFDNCGNRYFLAKLFDESDPRFSRAGARMFHACRLEARSKAPWIGVSNFNVQQLQRAQTIAPATSLQPRYSLVQREIEDEILLLPEGRNWGHRLFPDGFWSVDRRHALRASGESTQR